MILAFLISLYYLFTNLLFASSMLTCYIFWQLYRSRTSPLYLGNTEIPPIQVYILLGLVTALAFYFTSGSSFLSWILSAVVAVSCTHAIFREPVIIETHTLHPMNPRSWMSKLGIISQPPVNNPPAPQVHEERRGWFSSLPALTQV
eukprot:NODE_7305_length_792_cov_14.144993_g6696_i0.p1 GENE.NODE_7305_length_792_cov_14.144993_g6696_i0~~NODE_7305_length_792_cov_14.144993_g6696_i0.p1  ORF type:complete len:146 (-),score=18.22 NODE_7305_length_792_cov_14.144993_g6696_i0:53-490(-)